MRGDRPDRAARRDRRAARPVGKSTLLRHLNGLARPDSGEVEVLGVDVAAARGAELRGLRRRVADSVPSWKIYNVKALALTPQRAIR
ncbi:hypothetical protein [Nonomuraea jabiensis]|uniref:hypothetical protein n=1 Tax=Nonomuraea jabiensis TaxID=882448 RepID=UPI003D73FF85